MQEQDQQRFEQWLDNISSRELENLPNLNSAHDVTGQHEDFLTSSNAFDPTERTFPSPDVWGELQFDLTPYIDSSSDPSPLIIDETSTEDAAGCAQEETDNIPYNYSQFFSNVDYDHDKASSSNILSVNKRNGDDQIKNAEMNYLLELETFGDESWSQYQDSDCEDIDDSNQCTSRSLSCSLPSDDVSETFARSVPSRSTRDAFDDEEIYFGKIDDPEMQMDFDTASPTRYHGNKFRATVNSPEYDDTCLQIETEEEHEHQHSATKYSRLHIGLNGVTGPAVQWSNWQNGVCHRSMSLDSNLHCRAAIAAPNDSCRNMPPSSNADTGRSSFGSRNVTKDLKSSPGTFAQGNVCAKLPSRHDIFDYILNSDSDKTLYCSTGHQSIQEQNSILYDPPVSSSIKAALPDINGNHVYEHEDFPLYKLYSSAPHLNVNASYDFLGDSNTRNVLHSYPSPAETMSFNTDNVNTVLSRYMVQNIHLNSGNNNNCFTQDINDSEITEPNPHFTLEHGYNISLLDETQRLPNANLPVSASQQPAFTGSTSSVLDQHNPDPKCAQNVSNDWKFMRYQLDHHLEQSSAETPFEGHNKLGEMKHETSFAAMASHGFNNGQDDNSFQEIMVGNVRQVDEEKNPEEPQNNESSLTRYNQLPVHENEPIFSSPLDHSAIVENIIAPTHLNGRSVETNNRRDRTKINMPGRFSSSTDSWMNETVLISATRKMSGSSAAAEFVPSFVNQGSANQLNTINTVNQNPRGCVGGFEATTDALLPPPSKSEELTGEQGQVLCPETQKAKESQLVEMMRLAKNDESLKEAVQESVRTGDIIPVIKQELRRKIILKRHMQGKGDIEQNQAPRPVVELTAQEKERKVIAKERNRIAAKKCRKRKNEARLKIDRTLDYEETRNEGLCAKITQKNKLKNQLIFALTAQGLAVPQTIT